MTATLDTSLRELYANNFEIPFSDAGKKVEQWKRDYEQRLGIEDEVAYNKAIEKLHQAILDFMDDGLEMNEESVEIACEFLRKLSHYPYLLNTVNISADPEGKTVLRWKSEKAGKKGVFSMSIGKNRILYYASTIQGEEAHGKEFFDTDIPSAIWEKMRILEAH
ncbi:MAG: hypothetical protein SNJ55_03645 [Chloroherpetonaceae bacterium]